MTGPLPGESPELVQLAEHAAALYALEQAAQAASAGPLRAAVTAFMRFMTRQWVSAFGSTSAQANPVGLVRFVGELRGELRNIQPNVAAPLARYAVQAQQIGARQAVDELLLDGELAAVEADDLSVDVRQMLADLDDDLAEHLSGADQALGDLAGDAAFSDAVTAASPAAQAAASAERGAAWVTNRAANDGVAAVADELGVERIWIPERDACVHCLGLAGETSVDGVFDASKTFAAKPLAVWPGPDLTSPPRHPNCVIGSVRVATPGQGVVSRDEADVLARPVVDGIASAGDGGFLPASALAETRRYSRWVAARASTERDFVGQVVIVRTALGHEITCTPNHPVATRLGWVAAAELHVGDHVLSSTSSEWRVRAVDPHEDDIPPTIEEVAQALPVRLLPVPLAPEDFHGDGAGSEVCVVRTDSGLVPHLKSLCAQHARDQLLRFADVKSAALAHLRAFAQLNEGESGSAPSLVGGRSETRSFSRAGLGHPSLHGSATPARFDASFRQDSPDARAADAEGFCERLLADSSSISLDQVIDVRAVPFRGHVYNLETPDGWYIGNGIVTHNCRCRTQPWLGSETPAGVPDQRGALQREAARSILTGWRLPSESEQVRLGAAERLLLSGTTLPSTVQARARAAIKRGSFDTFPRIKTRATTR